MRTIASDEKLRFCQARCQFADLAAGGAHRNSPAHTSSGTSLPGDTARPWSAPTTPTSKKYHFDDAIGLRSSVSRHAGTSETTSVSRRMPKYSCTVVRGTCASLATAVKFTIVALHAAATRRKRL